MLINYYNRNYCKKSLQTIIWMSFQASVTNFNRTCSMLTNFYKKIISQNAYKLLSENSFPIMLTNYSKINHSKQNAYKLFLEKPFQTMLINYYKENHSKQYIRVIIRKKCWQILRGEIIPNNIYKLWSDNSFQTIFIYKLLLWEKSFQTKLTNYYHKIHFKHYLQTIIREIILNNASILLSEYSFQIVLINFY